MIADTDLGAGFAAAAFAGGLKSYESFNIRGPAFPTTREVIGYIAEKTGMARPVFSVPYPLGYLFAWLMEKLFPVLPGNAPFLTRSIVHLARDWACSTDYAADKLGYRPAKHWKIAIDEALEEIKASNYPWPHLEQL